MILKYVLHVPGSGIWIENEISFWRFSFVGIMFSSKVDEWNSCGIEIDFVSISFNTEYFSISNCLLIVFFDVIIGNWHKSIG